MVLSPDTVEILRGVWTLRQPDYSFEEYLDQFVRKYTPYWEVARLESWKAVPEATGVQALR